MSQLIQKNNDFSAKQDCIDNYCCVTHATALEFLLTDKNNFCREVNKMIVSSFLSEFNANLIDPSFTLHSYSNENTLNTVMPLLNSVQFWGRYKQQFDEKIESY